MTNTGIKCRVSKIFIRPSLKVRENSLDNTIKSAIDKKTKTTRFERSTVQNINIMTVAETPVV